MISARHVEQRRAPNAVFLGHANRSFDFRELARNHDLPRRIDVGNIDIFIRSQLAHLIFQPADHRRHSADCCRASFIHQFAALLYQFQSRCEIECSCSSVRGHFA